MTAIRQAERIMALETEVSYMRSEISKLGSDFNKLDSKIDDLLALRNKGAGAFWLASMLFGTGLVGAFTVAISWLKGHI